MLRSIINHNEQLPTQTKFGRYRSHPVSLSISISIICPYILKIQDMRYHSEPGRSRCGVLSRCEISQ